MVEVRSHASHSAYHVALFLFANPQISLISPSSSMSDPFPLCSNYPNRWCGACEWANPTCVSIYIDIVVDILINSWYF